ncbi:MAG: hypothetical protein QM617_04840 [Comamonas sp.]
MALLKDSEYRGLAVPSAYIRVVGPAINPDKTSMTFAVHCHAAAGTELLLAATRECAYDIDGPNPFCQAYAYLKTLAEFEGAEDVLEEGQTA